MDTEYQSSKKALFKLLIKPKLLINLFSKTLLETLLYDQKNSNSNKYQFERL